MMEMTPNLKSLSFPFLFSNLFLSFSLISPLPNRLRAKMKGITDKTDIIENRKSENEGRDENVMIFLRAVKKARNETSNMTNSHEVEEEEMEEFVQFLNGLEEEVKELYKEQAEMALDVDPVLTKAKLEKKRKEVEGKVRRFKYRPKRKAKIVEEVVVEEEKEEEEDEEDVVEDVIEDVVEEEGEELEEKVDHDEL